MKLYQVDAFTSEVYKGNPAGVCLVENEISDELMQKIASEMNLSETAFIERKDNNSFKLRWFTPKTEVDICGHATLAASYVLFKNQIISEKDVLTYDTRSGDIHASMKDSKVIMDFPQIHVKKTILSSELKEILNIEPIEVYGNEKRFLIEIRTLDELKNIKPDFAALAKYKHAFMITCRSEEPEYDFYSRFFAPCVGINEDPVTGSAHSYLAPYWSEKLGGKKRLVGYQASERSGVIECEIKGNDRVLLIGEAIIIFEIDLKV